MKAKMKGIDQTVIMIIFATLMLIIAIIYFYYNIFPYFTTTPCWAGAKVNVNVLSGIDFLREPQTIALGDCVSGLYLINDIQLEKQTEKIEQDFYKAVECDKGGQSYVLAVPKLPSDDVQSSGINIFKWVKNKALKFVGWIKSSVVKPYCRILSKEIRFNEPGIFEGNNIHCIDVGKDTDGSSYKVYFCPEDCDKCGPNPLNPGLFDDVVELPTNWKEVGGGF
jgi:hypothetical protein